MLVSTHYMDEAERCTRLAYIAWGELLTQGSPAQLLAGCGLVSRLVSSSDNSLLAGRLSALAAVQQVVALGDALHVSSTDGATLDASLAALAGQLPLKVTPTPTRLEDLFIQLMQSSREPRP